MYAGSLVHAPRESDDEGPGIERPGSQTRASCWFGVNGPFGAPGLGYGAT
jgi:hypothetical protein